MTLPAPLTPADCDLRDFQFMPLDVQRLRDSDLAALESPEACWIAVLLWGASWHQVPSGSLPDDDLILAKLAGFGRVVKEWLRVRRGALRGFVKCADGRLYHPVVADKAIEAWKGKLAQRWRTELARIKKQNQRTGGNAPSPTFEEWLLANGHDVPRDNQQMSPGTDIECPDGQDEASPLCPPGNGIQGTGIGTGILKEEANASLSPGGEAKPKPRSRTAYPEPFELSWRAYPHTQGRSSKPGSLEQWRKLPPDEQAELDAAIGRFAQNVEKVCGGKGAPDMAVWLKQAKHLNWFRAPEPGPVEQLSPEDRWRRALRSFQSQLIWRDELGPRPGRPGCRVPNDLLAEFDLTPAGAQMLDFSQSEGAAA